MSYCCLQRIFCEEASRARAQMRMGPREVLRQVYREGAFEHQAIAPPEDYLCISNDGVAAREKPFSKLPGARRPCIVRNSLQGLCSKGVATRGSSHCSIHEACSEQQASSNTPTTLVSSPSYPSSSHLCLSLVCG